MKITRFLLASLVIVSLASCKKDKTTTPTEETPVAADPAVERKAILTDITTNVIYATYTDLSVKANELNANIVAFNGASTAANLVKCQDSWKIVRSAWEQGEGFLFGPVSSDNIDPRIDTWPVDFARLDSVLASAAVLTPTYVDGLEESLKGFHPIEYLLFGVNGTKNETNFTNRQKEFLVALSLNLKSLCDQVKASWDPATANNYTAKFITAGSGNTTYPTQRTAFEEVVTAMADICGEVGDAKMKEPFDAVDPSLEESPFAKNSIADFTNNIKSVQNIYLGRYTTDGKGLEDLIKANNIAMDGNIKTKIASALTALGNITMPFGQAISTANGQRTQVQNAINALNDLNAYLDGDVKTYVQTLTN